jgi:carbon monoxide dehydrogenase subunit G
MKIEETFEIATDIDRMYRELNDVGHIGYCVAGVKQVDVVDHTHSRWRIEQRIGFMARTFNLDAQIVERRAPTFIGFKANGQDVEINGHVQLDERGSERTGCEILIDAAVTGPLAPLVDLMAKGPQQQLIQETINNLRRRLEAVASGEPIPEPSLPPTEEKQGFIARIKRLLEK